MKLQNYILTTVTKDILCEMLIELSKKKGELNSVLKKRWLNEMPAFKQVNEIEYILLDRQIEALKYMLSYNESEKPILPPDDFFNLDKIIDDQEKQNGKH